MYSKELIKGTVTTLIMRLLSTNQKMYGYEITQAVKEATDGKISLTLAAIYPILHKLKADGDLTTEKRLVGNRERIYYTLTEKGNQTAKEKLKEFTDYLNTMKSVMGLNKGFQSFVVK